LPLSATGTLVVLESFPFGQPGFTQLLLQFGQHFLFQCTAQYAVVPDADKAPWQNMHGKPTDELLVRQGYLMAFAAIPVIFG